MNSAMGCASSAAFVLGACADSGMVTGGEALCVDDGDGTHEEAAFCFNA